MMTAQWAEDTATDGEMEWLLRTMDQLLHCRGRDSHQVSLTRGSMNT